MTTVIAKPGENIESLLRRFKRAVDNSGILAELKKRSAYEKPSDKKRKEKAAARKRWLKRAKKLERQAFKKCKNKNLRWNKDRTKLEPVPPKRYNQNTNDNRSNDRTKRHRSNYNNKPRYKKENKS